VEPGPPRRAHLVALELQRRERGRCRQRGRQRHGAGVTDGVEPQVQLAQAAARSRGLQRSRQRRGAGVADGVLRQVQNREARGAGEPRPRQRDCKGLALGAPRGRERGGGLVKPRARCAAALQRQPTPPRPPRATPHAAPAPRAHQLVLRQVEHGDAALAQGLRHQLLGVGVCQGGSAQVAAGLSVQSQATDCATPCLAQGLQRAHTAAQRPRGVAPRRAAHRASRGRTP
jgi:hypothetical protein